MPARGAGDSVCRDVLLSPAPRAGSQPFFTKLYIALTESLRPPRTNWRITVGMQKPAWRDTLSAKQLEEIKMKKKILVFAGIAALVIGATVFALAQHPEMGEKMRGGGPGDMVEHMSR